MSFADSASVLVLVIVRPAGTSPDASIPLLIRPGRCSSTRGIVMSDFSGRVAVVTGAGHGIGAEYARHFAERGATVVIADIDAEAAATTAKDLSTAGGKATPLTLDIADADGCIAAVDGVVADHGSLDILINNAALY